MGSNFIWRTGAVTFYWEKRKLRRLLRDFRSMSTRNTKVNAGWANFHVGQCACTLCLAKKRLFWWSTLLISRMASPKPRLKCRWTYMVYNEGQAFLESRWDREHRGLKKFNRRNFFWGWNYRFSYYKLLFFYAWQNIVGARKRRRSLWLLIKN
jgi:hypothetical protein